MTFTFVGVKDETKTMNQQNLQQGALTASLFSIDHRFTLTKEAAQDLRSTLIILLLIFFGGKLFLMAVSKMMS